MILVTACFKKETGIDVNMLGPGFFCIPVAGM